MSDTRKRAKLYPIRLEGVYITAEQSAVIEREIARRPNPNPSKPARLRNGVIRDMIDFSDTHYPLFLRWLATRGESATTGE